MEGKQDFLNNWFVGCHALKWRKPGASGLAAAGFWLKAQISMWVCSRNLELSADRSWLVRERWVQIRRRKKTFGKKRHGRGRAAGTEEEQQQKEVKADGRGRERRASGLGR